MSDDYFNYLECLEYGEHFTTEVQKLAGTSNLVNVVALAGYVGAAMNTVAAELEKQGIQRSNVRVDRQDVEAKTGAMRKVLEKFHHYLGGLDDDEAGDIAAFFEGGNLGNLSAMKPADVAQHAGTVLRGFAANTTVLDGAKWQTRLEDAQTALVAALAGKGSSKGSSIQATAALVAAREGFLVAYNGVAKKVVAGLLTSLGRKGELRLYFKDLQVNESAPGKPVG
jgi:hypothetical protein